MHLGQIERRLALDHAGADLAVIAVGLHQRLTRGNRVLLGNSGGDAERNRGDHKHGTNMYGLPLSRRFCGAAQDRVKRSAGKATNRSACCQSVWRRRASAMVRHTRSGVAGISRWGTRSVRHSASTMAFITAGHEPMAPASPAPLTPSGLCNKHGCLTFPKKEGQRERVYCYVSLPFSLFLFLVMLIIGFAL